MSVIVELSLPSSAFELGRILDIESGSAVRLETMVPIGSRAVPLFRLRGDVREAFEEQVRTHPSVADIHEVSTSGDETLYALDWDTITDPFFEGVLSHEGYLLKATGTVQEWSFEIRFPSHDALDRFRTHCDAADIRPEVEQMFNPTNPDAGQYGLTPPQRETMCYAVENGYYDIPRGISTKDIADHFDVSDQAITERLRRAIDTLVTNTLLHPDEDG